MIIKSGLVIVSISSLAMKEHHVLMCAPVPLSRSLPSPYNCFMQIRQAERVMSQSEAAFSRGRSEFRGMKFGGKKTVLPHLLPPCMERGALRWTDRSGILGRIQHQRESQSFVNLQLGPDLSET